MLITTYEDQFIHLIELIYMPYLIVRIAFSSKSPSQTSVKESLA